MELTARVKFFEFQLLGWFCVDFHEWFVMCCAIYARQSAARYQAWGEPAADCAHDFGEHLRQFFAA